MTEHILIDGDDPTHKWEIEMEPTDNPAVFRIVKMEEMDEQIPTTE